MDFIIALFCWLGWISPGQVIDQDYINQNQATIDQYSNDTDFLNYYESQKANEGVVQIYVEEF